MYNKTEASSKEEHPPLLLDIQQASAFLCCSQDTGYQVPHMQEEGSSAVISEEMGSSSGSNDGIVSAQYEAGIAITSTKQGATSNCHTLPPPIDQQPWSEINNGNTQSYATHIKMAKRPMKPIPCPRCNSLDTKFCYFNNYNVNQPRHFCKGCQRYWTAGGTLRNVPVGAGCRKHKHVATTQQQKTVVDAGLAGKCSSHQSPGEAPRMVLGTWSNQVYGEGGSCGSVQTSNHDASFNSVTSRMSALDYHGLVDTTLTGNIVQKVDGVMKVQTDYRPIVCSDKIIDGKTIPSTNGQPNESAGTSCITSQPLVRECVVDSRVETFNSDVYAQSEERGNNVPLHENGGSWQYGSNMPCNDSVSASPCMSGLLGDSQASMVPPLNSLPPLNSFPWLGASPRMWAGRPPWPVKPTGTPLTPTVCESGYARTGQKHMLDSNEGCLWVPKTLRIDDPVEAARSSIWTTLGLGDRPSALAMGDASMALCENTKLVPEEPTTQTQHFNPAATTLFTRESNHIQKSIGSFQS